MAMSQTHAGTQRQQGREQSLLRPARDPANDIQAVFHPQRVLGNLTAARGGALPPEGGSGALSIRRFLQRAASIGVQPKLELGPVDDAFEREADQVAEQVVQRLAAPTVQRQEEEEEEPLQGSRSSSGPDALDPAVESMIQRARGGGSPLPNSVRSPMEANFGSDFGGVRVHTGSQPNQLNQQLQARAFTTGRDIFFRDGEYDPASSGGQRLLAHELTHVVQQGAAGSVRTKRLQAGDVQRKIAEETLFFGSRLS